MSSGFIVYKTADNSISAVMVSDPGVPGAGPCRPGNPEPEKPMTLDRVVEVYSQDPDSCSDSDVCHTLELVIEDAGAGPYAVIRTARWALDDDEIDVLVAKLRAALDRVKRAQAEREVARGA
jgi:hypothetical protein